MKASHIRYLVCPRCRQPLDLTEAAERMGDNVLEGSLHCAACHDQYAIVCGVPRFVPERNYADSFGFEWLKHARTQYDSYTGTRITETRFFNETRWLRDLRGQTVLEVGCGSGRFTEQAALTGAMVVSMDCSTAVEANYASNGSRENVLIVQADLYQMPFQPASFDKLFCFGVLQHTPDVEKAFLSLPPYLKAGGELVVDVYARMRGLLPFLLRVTHTKNLVRPITRRMAPARLYALCERYIKVVWPLAKRIGRFERMGPFILRRFLIPPYFGIYDLPEPILKEWITLDMFDSLSPAYENDQYIETVRAWFEQAGLQNVDVRYGYNGIEGHASKPPS